MGDEGFSLANVGEKNLIKKSQHSNTGVDAHKPLTLPFEFYTQCCDPCVRVFYVGIRVASRG